MSISRTGFFMSDSVNIMRRDGAYEHPFSGDGVEFSPLGVQADHAGIVLHETGFDPCNSNWNFPSVLSPFWRIYYNTRRSHCVVFGDDCYELDPEHILLIPDRQLFHCLGQKPTPSFWIHFSFDRRLAPDQAVPILLRPEEFELGLIAQISSLILAGSLREYDRIRRLSLALINMLISRPEIQWGPILPELLVRLLVFIDEQAGCRLSNRELAQRAGISIEGVYRLFRNHLGVSPAVYVNQVRIRKASHLLLEHRCSMDEVAELCGFPNRAYFSRVFKKVTGISPAAFRRGIMSN